MFCLKRFGRMSIDVDSLLSFLSMFWDKVLYGFEFPGRGCSAFQWPGRNQAMAMAFSVELSHVSQKKPMIQWVGLREKLQEHPIEIMGKSMVSG